MSEPNKPQDQQARPAIFPGVIVSYVSPLIQQPLRSWDALPPQEGIDQWRYMRRCELAQLATLFIIAEVREGLATAGGSDEPWKTPDREDRDARDREAVRRAVALAKYLQDEVDRARPRQP